MPITSTNVTATSVIMIQLLDASDGGWFGWFGSVVGFAVPVPGSIVVGGSVGISGVGRGKLNVLHGAVMFVSHISHFS